MCNDMPHVDYHVNPASLLRRGDRQRLCFPMWINREPLYSKHTPGMYVFLLPSSVLYRSIYVISSKSRERH
jgi:hypothetical protein